MKPLCELMGIEILPTVRALVAKKLIDTYGLSQKQAAEKLGTTQPAISQYKRNLRGYRTSVFSANPELMGMVDSLARRTASGLPLDQQSREFCGLCRTLVKDGTACRLHRESDECLGTCSICHEK